MLERLVNKLENWRRVITRYDKTRESYLRFVALASTKLWIPFVHTAQQIVAFLICNGRVLQRLGELFARATMHMRELYAPSRKLVAMRRIS